MKRRVITVLVAICLVLCTMPMVAFADESGNGDTDTALKISSLSFTVNGYVRDGNTKDITISVDGSAEQLTAWYGTYGSSVVISTTGGTVKEFLKGVLSTDKILEPKTDYYLGIIVQAAKGYDLQSLEASNVTLKLGNQTLQATSLEKYYLNYIAIVKLPQLADVTITAEMPITKTVTLGGNTAPDETTFEYEIFDQYGEEYTAERLKSELGISYTASVTTNGAGTFTGKLVITGRKNGVKHFLHDGFVIREKVQTDSNWTSDDSEWMVRNYFEGVEYDSLKTIKGTLDSDKGYFYGDADAGILDSPIFTSVYTKNTSSQSSGGSGTPGDSGTSGGSGSSGGSSSSGGSTSPENPGTPTTPDNPGTSGGSSSSGGSTTPDNPGTPTTPDNPTTPLDPENPTIPDQKSDSSEKLNSLIPKTGDESNLGLWMTLVLMSGVAVTETTIACKRKSSK